MPVMIKGPVNPTATMHSRSPRFNSDPMQPPNANPKLLGNNSFKHKHVSCYSAYGDTTFRLVMKNKVCKARALFEFTTQTASAYAVLLLSYPRPNKWSKGLHCVFFCGCSWHRTSESNRVFPPSRIHLMVRDHGTSAGPRVERGAK